MKVLLVLAFAVACVNASSISKIAEKLMPSFTTGHIIKGEDADRHAAPFIVSLSNNEDEHQHMCGGTIIDREWILTAAHCFMEPVGISAIAGLHERINLDENTQSRVVDFAVIHDGFEFPGGAGPHDIAILHVSEPFEFNEFVQPAVLPVRDEIPYGQAQLYGWGQPKSFVLTAAETLQTVETEILDFDECMGILPEDNPLQELNICSNAMDSHVASCNGDSGGPLVQEHPGARSELVGIVSWGYIPCGVLNLPSVYTRISAYVDWIHQIKKSYYDSL